jgi:DNA modification methylase
MDIPVSTLPVGLKDFQASLTRWALKKGRAAIFADTGLGKTWMQVAWAAQIPGRVLILAPLCVTAQTIGEAAKMGIAVGLFGSGAQIETTNYERLHHVTYSDYTGIVLDESSILKSFDGKTRTKLIALFQQTPYRLCCTATPAPNDIAELANHCEFLGIMTRPEMLATFFVHDENGWRLKGHAHDAFYRWLSSWGMFLRHPSELGFSDDGYQLPGLSIEQVVVDSGATPHGEFLFPGMGLGGIRGRNFARHTSLDARVTEAARIVCETPGQWIVWCGLNDEQTGMAALLNGDYVSVAGQDDEEKKRERITAFLSGEARVLVTKPKIAGFGLNLQCCHNMIFLGIGDSYEIYYQSIRRCYRFGQTSPVTVKIVVSEAETEIVSNVQRKEDEASKMASDLMAHVVDIEREEIGMQQRERQALVRDVANGERWTLHQGDCVEEMANIPDGSVDLSVFSPPFKSLYTYTNSERDIGNSSTREEFLAHLGYMVKDLFRITKPGRLACCHIQQIATQLAKDGVIGMEDLRGRVIDLFIANGWIHHGEITIDKDPQAQAIRTHSKALLFVQLKKDSSWLRPALADYIAVFRKPGENAIPIHPDIGNNEWIEWARPIWYGIRESDTLNVREGRANDDDRHICPLQLGTIERCVRLWSNPGELVFSPFAGIGSEGYQAILNDRRFLGVELKPEYYRAAKVNLSHAETYITAQQILRWTPPSPAHSLTGSPPDDF